MLLQFIILIPFISFFLSLAIPKKREALLSKFVFATVALQFATCILLAVEWFMGGMKTFNVNSWTLLKAGDFEFFLDFSFDKVALVFVFVGATLTMLVTMYSRYYLHREEGYKRYFNTILFFYTGYNIAVLAGNMETLFVGWEILGLTSFLLISFYRERYLPVQNGLKVFSIYRIGDIGLLLAIWMMHHFWHANITFSTLQNSDLLTQHLQHYPGPALFIALMIVLAAMVKSAQMPFSSWLPRAMEGPTPSSAIFYGSLSVHLGAFLLIRTFPFWSSLFVARGFIIVIGLSTCIIASLIARVQSSVKGQIAYSSVAQIGIIFIEIALGFDNLALFHFAGNAFLRTYQLLVSPSTVSYLIREQFFNFIAPKTTLEDSLPRKLEYSFYILSLREWDLDNLVSRYFFKPIEKISRFFDFFSLKWGILLFVPIYCCGLGLLKNKELVPLWLINVLPTAIIFMGLLMVVKSFTERDRPETAWLLIIMNHLWAALAISFNDSFGLNQSFVYLCGIIVGGIAGLLCIVYMRSKEHTMDLKMNHGHIYEHKSIALVFLIAALCLAAFPITPSFIGEDLMLSHIRQDQIFLAVITTVSYMFGGLCLIRVYSRIFLGPHEKTYHEIAYKSA